MDGEEYRVRGVQMEWESEWASSVRYMGTAWALRWRSSKGSGID